MFKYILLGLILSFNAIAADTELNNAREQIGSNLNSAVREIKQLFNQSEEDLNNVETKDIDNKSRVESLKQKSEEDESNPTVLKHAKKAIPNCDYNSKNLVWDGSTWKCVTMNVDTECQAAAPDEYMYKDANGNNVCAKSPKGSAINYYYTFRGYGSKCTGAYSGYEKLYDCVYRNKLGQIIDVDTGNCSGKTKPSQSNKLCARSWSTGSWGSCSRSCGGGSRSRSVYCQAGYDCSMYSRPSSSTSCNTHKCSGTWSTGSWSSCSATACGTTGTQTRSVSCPSNLDCSSSPKPSSSRSCSAPACVAQCTWSVGSWGSCSATACGTSGTQTRSVTKSGPAGCTGPSSPKPASSQSCKAAACGQCTWSVGSWGSCSATACGTTGTQYRSVSKSGPAGCTGPTSPKPASSQSCKAPACRYTYSWQTGNWGSCSKSCGGGSQRRSVTCKRSDGASVSGSHCGGSTPASSRSCNTQACISYSWYTSSWGSCSVDCGYGVHHRTVYCRGSDGKKYSNSKCSGSSPSSVGTCKGRYTNTGYCGDKGGR